MRGALPLAIAGLLSAGCAAPSSDFPLAAARTHVVHLGAAVGSRPAGTAANRRAREYLLEVLTRAGFAVRVQSTESTSPIVGVTGIVNNIIAVSDGPAREAVALVAHYDSIAEGPGAADDGFGTAVVVESARVLAARRDRRWSLMVVLTDAEEHGLLGAAAAVEDAEVFERVKVVINLEAMGAAQPVLLFETGPANGWLAKVWAGSAPRPRGSSFNYEIYRRMPNDTDFSVFRRAGIPGLNLAAVGDAYAYHTAAETPARVTDSALAQAGATVIGVVDALQREEIRRRTPEQATYFDLLGVTAVAWTPAVDRVLVVLALAAGAIALARLVLAIARAGGVRALVLLVLWSAAGAAAVVAGAIGSVALQRAVREVYHPWYAQPGRFALMIVLCGAAAGWLVGRLALHLPAKLRLPRIGAVVLAPTVAVWMALAGVMAWSAPRAAYLWILPLLALAMPMAIGGGAPGPALTASAAALATSAVLWLPDTSLLFPFLVALTGNLQVLTPVWVLPALLLLAALMLAPPAIALVVASGLPRVRFATRALLVSAGLALGWAYWSPAYTAERPLRLTLASVSGEGGRQATIDIVAGNEPVPALGPGAPLLTPVPSVPPPYGRYVGRAPFASMAPPGPARRSAAVTCAVEGDHTLVTVVPAREGMTARLELPPGAAPASSSPPGRLGDGRWTATLVALPAAGATFRLRMPEGGDSRGCDGRLAVGLPGPADPDGDTVPGWLAHPGVAWRFRVVDIIPLR